MNRPPREFFVNGHNCQIKREGRERYSGWINGEQVVDSYDPTHVQDSLLRDTKYREQRAPEFWKEVRAVHRYVDDKDGWVLGNTIGEAVYPDNTTGVRYLMKAYELQSLGLLEKDTIFTGLNDEDMWRSTEEDAYCSLISDVTDPKEEYSNG